MAQDIAVGVAVLAVVIAGATAGRHLAKSDNRQKSEILSTLDGQDVILWLSSGGGSVQTVVPRRGRLRVGERDGSSVVLLGDKDRLVFLEQIRWIEDPKTGKRFGDRWYGKLR